MENIPFLIASRRNGDTVGVTSEDLKNGFIVDVYSEDDSWFYEKDMWGAWKQSGPS